MTPISLTDFSPQEKNALEAALAQAIEHKKEELRVAEEQRDFFSNLSKNKNFAYTVFEVFEHIHDVVMFIDKDFILRWVNTATLKLLSEREDKEIKAEDILGKPCFELHGIGLPCNGCILEEAIKNNKTVFNPSWFGPKSGREYSVIAIPFANGTSGCIEILALKGDPEDSPPFPLPKKPDCCSL